MYTGIELILKDKEILPFETMWMTLEYIILSKINQTQKDNYSRILCVNYHKSQMQKHRAEQWVPEAGRWHYRASHTSELAIALQFVEVHQFCITGSCTLASDKFSMNLIIKPLPVSMKMRECIRFCKEHKAPTLSLLPSCWLCASYSPVLISNVTSTKRFFQFSLLYSLFHQCWFKGLINVFMFTKACKAKLSQQISDKGHC